MTRNPAAPFALRLRTLREAADMTQAQLAEKSGLSPSWISHFECGARRPGFDALGKLATALGVSVDALVRGHGKT